MLNIKLVIERWKWNDSYEVWVSTEGRIKDKKKKIIIPFMLPTHYMGIVTRHGKRFPVHRIVIETWIGSKPAELYSVDHINHNRHDNRVCNLRWLPIVENQEYERKITINAYTIMCSSLREMYEKCKTGEIHRSVLNIDTNTMDYEHFYDKVKKAIFNGKKYAGCYFIEQNGFFLCTPVSC